MNYYRILKHRLLFYIWRLLEKIFRRYMLFGFVNTKYGIKNININQLIADDKNIISEQLELTPDKLLLGPDFLKDNYTHLNVPINESPHFYFMKDISESRNLSQSIYITKFYRGLLDWRHIQPIVLNYEGYIKKYKDSCVNIRNNSYIPVLVYTVNGVFYIADGKHRAALCAYLNKNVLCKVIDAKSALGAIDKFVLSVMEKNSSYSKHVEFYKKIW